MKKWLSILLCVLFVFSACSSMAEGNVYAGEADGFGGKIKVEVTLENDRITDITVTEHSETNGIGTTALDTLPEKMVANQSIAVDGISGCTFSSNGLKEAVKAALESAGVDMSSFTSSADADESTAEKTQTSQECDILVVGAGMAGLTFSLRASSANKDARIVMVEKMPFVGGTASLAGGSLIAVGSELFKDKNYDKDNVESMMAFWRERSAFSGAESGFPDWDRLEGVLAETGATIDFMGENGVPWLGEIVGDFGDYPVVRCEGKGANLVASMAEACKANGVTVLTEHAGTSLVMDGDAVVGAVVETADKTITFHAKNVILCTGGISRNAEMVEKYSPKVAKAQVVPLSGQGHTGDGLTMAIVAGAGVFDEFSTALRSIAIDPAMNEIVEASALGTPAKLSTSNQLGVDATGSRFANEYAVFLGALGSKMLQNSNAPFWFVYDSSDAEVTAMMESGVEIGAVAKGQDIRELAQSIGVDPDTLEASYNRYNSLAFAGVDEDFGKDAEHLVALETAPFYAVKFFPSTFGSIGGVYTSEEGKALREDGSVITGLYALGEMSNRYFYNEDYILGSSLSLTATMAVRAADSVLSELQK